MKFLKIDQKFINPESGYLEIVERKGLGHPDTLADALSELVSIEYSKYCLENFGCVLHHNVDKLYIGAGLFENNFGYSKMIKPIKVVINGRMSNSFGNQIIDLEDINRKAIIPYLFSVLPNLKDGDVVIESNVTQHTKNKFWYNPRNITDVPDAVNPKANDTSVVLYHSPMTVCEMLTYELENYFWDKTGRFPHPKYLEFGQDIKVMVCRKGKNIEAVLCVPVISRCLSSFSDYYDLVGNLESNLNKFARKIIPNSYVISVKINPSQIYILGIGSCIECGEEGIVGRGNSLSGVISIFRPSSMEAWSGKNPVYHTGRVMSYLVKNLSEKLFEEFNVKCSVLAMTNAGGSLVPPQLLQISLNKKIPKDDLERVVKDYFLEINYLKEILSQRMQK